MNKAINPHFEDLIFNWDHKFYFLVGGYGSSKSYHVALKLILKLLQEKRTALVVREVYDTMRDSCFSLLSEIIEELELGNLVKTKVSPMSLEFANGSKVIFKGMDKPAKLKSINNVSIVWIEECSEVKYEGFKELLGRLRHPSLKLHMILSTNPVSKNNWTFKHFFEDYSKGFYKLSDQELYDKRNIIVDDTYYHHSVADDNYFLPSSYIEQLDELKVHDPDLWRIARKGQFGINGKVVFPQFEVMEHEQLMKEMKALESPFFRVGMDFGFVTSFNAVVRCCVDHKNKTLYLYYEYYSRDKTDIEIAKDIQEFKRTRELIKADCAEPKAIRFYRQEGFKMVACRKFKGSREQYTKKIKRFKRIVCSNKCPNIINELKELTYKVDKNGEVIEDEFNIDPHTLSAIWYALDDYEVSNLKGGGVEIMK